MPYVLLPHNGEQETTEAHTKEAKSMAYTLHDQGNKVWSLSEGPTCMFFLPFIMKGSN